MAKPHNFKLRLVWTPYSNFWACDANNDNDWKCKYVNVWFYCESNKNLWEYKIPMFGLFSKKKKFTTSKCGTTGRWLLRFHHIPGSSSHEDCNCNFWKSQKPIEPGVCAGSEFSSSSSSLWYLWAYPTVPWDVG